MPNRFDITEFIKQKHHRITIIREIDPVVSTSISSAGVLRTHKERRCLCKCDCGTIWEVSLKYIKDGKIKSCGCFSDYLRRNKTIHGMCRRNNLASEYNTWASMIQRCTNKKEKCYKWYGGRGISVCERWRTFSNFFEDMGEKPSRKYSIERINVDGNYEPGNCKWATSEEQHNNMRSSRKIEYNGVVLTLSQWAKKTNINGATIHSRLKVNWTIHQALTTRPGAKPMPAGTLAFPI